MATVPIVTEVTKAQLDALVAANGLNEGLQYKVTDKDWFLIAQTNNILKPISGTLIIFLPDLLPDYIDTQVLIIDTGEYNPSITQFKNFIAGSSFIIDKIICENRSNTLISNISVIDANTDEQVSVTPIPVNGKICFQDIGYTLGTIKLIDVGHSYNIQISDVISSELSSELHRVVVFFTKIYN